MDPACAERLYLPSGKSAFVGGDGAESERDPGREQSVRHRSAAPYLAQKHAGFFLSCGKLDWRDQWAVFVTPADKQEVAVGLSGYYGGGGMLETD